MINVLERGIVLNIDDPAQQTLTTFSVVSPDERPSVARRVPIGSDISLRSADIRMPRDEAGRVLGEINQLWDEEKDALYKQYLGEKTEVALILGYTIISLGDDRNLACFRIYTS